jgi:hypothetical protein
LVFFIGFLIEVKLENQILTCMKKPATYRGGMPCGEENRLF